MTPASNMRRGYDPFGEMRRLQDEMNRLFGGSRAAASRGAGDFPPVNLWLGSGSVAVTAEIAGVAPDDIEITVHEDSLTIAGERKPPIEGESVAWHRRERAFGKFRRIVQLPFRVDADKVQARFSNGVLEVELQRPEQDRPRTIKVKA